VLDLELMSSELAVLWERDATGHLTHAEWLRLIELETLLVRGVAAYLVEGGRLDSLSQVASYCYNRAAACT
jgi:hypothetical protein